MRKLTTEEFIERAKSIHGDKYDYSQINYVESKKDVIVNCFTHGSFKVRPDHFLNGHGCPECGKIKCHNSNYRRKTTKSCIEDFKKVWGGLYVYDKVNYRNAHTKVLVKCLIHGYFPVTPNNHLNGKGCPLCNSSHGENEIRRYLQEHNILFEEQKKFSDCRNKLPLPFDFYLPDYNLCIEYQGIQHFEINNHFGGEISFKDRQRNDAIKKAWCSQPENPDLLEITYKDNVEDMEEKLSSIL